LQHVEEQAKEAARKVLGTGTSVNEQVQKRVNVESMSCVKASEQL